MSIWTKFHTSICFIWSALCGDIVLARTLYHCTCGSSIGMSQWYKSIRFVCWNLKNVFCAGLKEKKKSCDHWRIKSYNCAECDLKMGHCKPPPYHLSPFRSSVSPSDIGTQIPKTRRRFNIHLFRSSCEPDTRSCQCPCWGPIQHSFYVGLALCISVHGFGFFPPVTPLSNNKPVLRGYLLPLT